MKAPLIWSVLLVCMLFTGLVSAATTYTYTGNNFDQVTGEYSISDSVSGSFTAGVLPADMDIVDISQQVLSYRHGWRKHRF